MNYNTYDFSRNISGYWRLPCTICGDKTTIYVGEAGAPNRYIAMCPECISLSSELDKLGVSLLIL